MGACATVVCPHCGKEFVVSPDMLGKGYEYHCPFCDVYFQEQESPKVVKG